MVLSKGAIKTNINFISHYSLSYIWNKLGTLYFKSISDKTLSHRLVFISTGFSLTRLKYIHVNQCLVFWSLGLITVLFMLFESVISTRIFILIASKDVTIPHWNQYLCRPLPFTIIWGDQIENCNFLSSIKNNLSCNNKLASSKLR